MYSKLSFGIKVVYPSCFKYLGGSLVNLPMIPMHIVQALLNHRYFASDFVSSEELFHILTETELVGYYSKNGKTFFGKIVFIHFYFKSLVFALICTTQAVKHLYCFCSGYGYALYGYGFRIS